MRPETRAGPGHEGPCEVLRSLKLTLRIMGRRRSVLSREEQDQVCGLALSSAAR